MRIDAERLPRAATLTAEVAIVGAGPAGITLALELAAAGHRVLLIESGQGSYNAETERLGDTVGSDPAHAPMALAARRQIGGTSNLWAGRCVPFDPVDFESRAVVGDASWPVGYGELERYFQRACDYLKCGPPDFDADQIPALADDSLIAGWPPGQIRATALERWSLPTNFRKVYGSKLRYSNLITLATGLTCTEVVCGPAGRSVEHLKAKTLAGKEIQVNARRYVIACGGVESTRLLLASRRHHLGGIGNHSGHLGCWYMSHVGASIAQARFNTSPRTTIYGFERDSGGVYVRRRFTFTQDFLIKHDLPNMAMWLENPEISDPSHGNEILSSIYLALASPLGALLIAEGIRRRKLGAVREASIRLHLRNVVRHLPRAMKFALGFGYQRYLRPGRKVPGIFVPSASNTYRIYYHGEHLPHPESRITLTGDLDALGMPRVQTNLRFTDTDIQSAIRVHSHFDRQLRRTGFGCLQYLYEDLEASFREQLFDGYHQAGTTRMALDAEDGVLDPQLAVHGFEDLFVASSSAFVTSGQANSTFMIVVFALRLADHLHRALHREVR